MDLNKNAKPNETIREHTDKLKKDAEILFKLGYISDKCLYDDLLAACEFHDYGKANSEFQKRIKRGSKFNPATEIPHSVLSLFYIDKEKCNNYLSVCFAVLYHHYHSNADSPKSVLNNEADLINKFLLEMGGTYVPYKKMKFFANKVIGLFKKTFDDEEKLYAALLKGFLHKCDYSASAGIDCEIENDFLDSVMQIWLESDSKIQIRPLQKFCLENKDSDLIITAPTGMGKTEAGLFWCGNHKCFFVLPLKTAINAMYDRIKKLSGNEYKNRVALIHSDMYEKLKDYYNGKIEVNLFHSRFIRKDRKTKESKILKAEERTEPEIWVSTSVVEASLDIDFDMLFTELSDLFSLFQRFGRVNRRGEKDFDEYNAYVFTELQGNAKKGFIDETIHQLSKEAIMTVDGIVTETDKNNLINEYLSVEKIENSDYYKKYKESYNCYSEKIEYIDKDTSLRDIDTVSVIPNKVYEDNVIVIKQAQDIIKSNDSTYSEKLEANEKIMDLTVSISRHRFINCGTVAYISSRYNQIPILDNCEYNDKDGLIITGKAKFDEIVLLIVLA